MDMSKLRQMHLNTTSLSLPTDIFDMFTQIIINLYHQKVLNKVILFLKLL